MELERWLQLMGAWGFGRNEDGFDTLVKAYSEQGRYYHTEAHIDACLTQLDKCIAAADHPREVEIALWFHDAIYKPLSGDNERQSADWAAAFVSANGATEAEAERVHRLIMATEHNAPTQTKDESILVDVDLAILGADPELYAIFEQGIREEYRLVPWFMYRKKRIEILRGFLARDQIYQNEPFSTEREILAKENLAHAVLELGGRG